MIRKDRRKHTDNVIGLASGLDFKKVTRKSLMEGTHIRSTALWDFFTFHLLSWYFYPINFLSYIHIVLIILISLICSQSKFWRLYLHLWDQNVKTLSALWVDIEVLGCKPLPTIHLSLKEPVGTQVRTLVRNSQRVYGSDSFGAVSSCCVILGK